MKLRRIEIENFRGFAVPLEVEVDDFTAFIGRNDIGKSSILAALTIFLEGEGVKIMRHDRSETCTPNTARRGIDAGDVAEVARFADKYLPFANGGVNRASVCLYTMTPDNHFVIDRHTEFPGLVYASACSGHGFKFAPVIGEVLAELALEGSTDKPMGFLSATRFGEPRRNQPEKKSRKELNRR